MLQLPTSDILAIDSEIKPNSVCQMASRSPIDCPVWLLFQVEGRWTDRFMKLMVVGESGQGKTTFIHNSEWQETGNALLMVVAFQG